MSGIETSYTRVQRGTGETAIQATQDQSGSRDIIWHNFWKGFILGLCKSDET